VIAHPGLPLDDLGDAPQGPRLAGEPMRAGALAERLGNPLQVGVRQSWRDAAWPLAGQRLGAALPPGGMPAAGACLEPPAGGRPRPAEPLGRTARPPAGGGPGGWPARWSRELGRQARWRDGSRLACSDPALPPPPATGPGRSPRGPKPFRRGPLRRVRQPRRSRRSDTMSLHRTGRLRVDPVLAGTVGDRGGLS
jgi:hypothetical protein